ncbi:hypothetical protein LINGRAHAP2_LOCUS19942 [Linum grandiflorum]
MRMRSWTGLSGRRRLLKISSKATKLN